MGIVAFVIVSFFDWGFWTIYHELQVVLDPNRTGMDDTIPSKFWYAWVALVTSGSYSCNDYGVSFFIRLLVGTAELGSAGRVGHDIQDFITLARSCTRSWLRGTLTRWRRRPLVEIRVRTN
jgi:hypothetical protein